MSRTFDLPRAAAALDRRAFLRLAGAAAAAGLLPTGCGGVPETLAPPATLHLAVLSPRAYATLNAAGACIVGPQGAALIERRTVDVAALADQLLSRSPAIARPLSQGLAVLEYGVWPLVAKVQPFTSLSEPARDAVLADLERSRIETKRALFAGVRALVLSTFYGSPATRLLSGYPGPFGFGAVTIADGMEG
jgi:hypothetical protein